MKKMQRFECKTQGGAPSCPHTPPPPPLPALFYHPAFTQRRKESLQQQAKNPFRFPFDFRSAHLLLTRQSLYSNTRKNKINNVRGFYNRRVNTPVAPPNRSSLFWHPAFTQRRKKSLQPQQNCFCTHLPRNTPCMREKQSKRNYAIVFATLRRVQMPVALPRLPLSLLAFLSPSVFTQTPEEKPPAETRTLFANPLPRDTPAVRENQQTNQKRSPRHARFLRRVQTSVYGKIVARILGLLQLYAGGGGSGGQNPVHARRHQPGAATAGANLGDSAANRRAG